MTDLFTPAGGDQEPDYMSYVKAKFAKEDGTIDLEALAKAKFKSDEHIANLEKEQSGVREELSKRLSFEEVLAKIEANRQQSTTDDNQASSVAEVGEKSLTPEEIRKLTLDTLTQEQQKVAFQNNVKTVRDTLQNAWGAGFADKLKQVCAELDISEEEAGQVAMTKPKAFLKLVLGDNTPRQVDNVAPMSSSMRMTNEPTNLGVKNWAYFEKIRVANPAEYWSPKVQLELHRQAIKLGDAFRV
jgi:hypothetical protein